MMAITLKPAEAHLREVLIGLAAEADPSDPSASALSYGDLAATADPDGSLGWKPGHPRYSKLITALFHVNTYEVEHGRPMIGAFAVSVDSRTSGSGFAALGRELGRAVGEGKDAERTFWRGELADAVACWSDKSADGGLSDAQYDAIMAELAILRRSVRALAHGGPARRDEAERANAPGTPLTRHEQYNVFSYLVDCPYEDCRAKARHRCVGAVSHPDGYPSTIHAGREQAWEALVNGLTAGLTREQAAEIWDRFRKPVTQEIRRAVADTILVPADRH